MKPLLLVLVVLLAVAFVTSAAETDTTAKPKAKAKSSHPEGFQELAIGQAAPDFSLKGIDDKTHTLAEYKDAKVLMIAFMSNHCPTSQAVEGRLKKLLADKKGQGFQIVAINPNNPVSLRPDELGYSIYNDSFDEMKLHAKEQGFEFPYLYDGDTQAIAKAYGCLATPHVFIFDAERKLKYKGRLDDSRFADAATVTSNDGLNAVEALLAGKTPAVAETKPHGCSTKWLTKTDDIAKDNEKWEKTAVDVELIDAAGVAALRKNGTKKVRLINVWATWCGPCREEFPELAKTARKFGLRDFEFITISLNTPDEKDQVKKFLEKYQVRIPDKIKPTLKVEGRTTNSYIYSGANQDDLVKALDPQWPGPIPYTLLVAPDGSVIFRHDGEINGDELRAKILEFMGRYYVPES